MPVSAPRQPGDNVKLLQVVHQFPPGHVGGTEIYVASLSRVLQERGHRVSVFFGGDARGEELRDGLRLCVAPGGLDPLNSGWGTFRRAFGNRDVESAFASLLRREAPSVVHFHHLAGLSSNLVDIARRAGTPTIITLHDYWFLCPNSQAVTPKQRVCCGSRFGLSCAVCAAYRLRRPYLSAVLSLAAPVFALRNYKVWQALKKANLVIAPSRFIAQIFTQRGLEPSRIAHLPLGIEGPVAAPARRRPDGKLRFAYLGSLAWQKGVHIVVEAFNSIDHRVAELFIYGDENVFPEYSAGLRQAARGRGIHLMGRLSRDELWTTLAQVDTLVVPSLWYENWPLVVQEAFAVGIPVIASRIGALAEQVADGVDGLLFETGDVGDLLDKVRVIIEDRHILQHLCHGIRPVETMSHHVAAVERLYQLLEGSSSGLSAADSASNRVLWSG
ncbi:MAG: glycosyltransferase family 4 protein [Chloroflexi bacterium]|nr:glycosyltransferase family 4 protein [Chloroflexota bacterium]